MSLPDNNDRSKAPRAGSVGGGRVDALAAGDRLSQLSATPLRHHVSLSGTWLLIQNLPEQFDGVAGHGSQDVYDAVRALSFETRSTVSGGVAIDVRVSPQTILELIETYGLIASPRALAALREASELLWQEQALCKEADPEQFFPEKGGATTNAKKLCKACPVRGECLEYALSHDERFGIWGGLSERERRRLKPRRRSPRRTAVVAHSEEVAASDYGALATRRVG
ncbi:hypothetical protein MAHJHV61_36990 [Mycobacterium avium subsp. hominissuis]